MKVHKAKASEWAGNGFGTTAAQWVVTALPHIAILQLGAGWVAVDTNTNKRIVNGAATRADALEILATKV